MKMTIPPFHISALAILFLGTVSSPTESFVLPSWTFQSICRSRSGSSSLYSSQIPNQSEAEASEKSKNSPPADSFLQEFFNGNTKNNAAAALSPSCDSGKHPPSLNILLRNLQQLTQQQSSDIRGRFVDHARFGSLAAVAHEIHRAQAQLTGGPSSSSTIPALTPLAAYCIGHGLAVQLLQEEEIERRKIISKNENSETLNDDSPITICIGRDPRAHGTRLADALARGAESADAKKIKVVYTEIATTPACAAFCSQLHKCQAAIMVTASHLPSDRNGFKLYSTAAGSGFSKEQIQQIGQSAIDYCAEELFTTGIVPPTSGQDAVLCSTWVDWMPEYAASLQQAIVKEVGSSVCGDDDEKKDKPLLGLKIVLNSGNGSGGFFASVLESLGADISGSIHLEPDPNFPNGVPNPEQEWMFQATAAACEKANADLGIMFDTDADRSGFVVPRDVDFKDGTCSGYEVLNRNRLIALLGVVFARSHPGSAIVTDSVTSEGLATFLEVKLGLKHVRYLKGYSNVINKAKELTSSGICDAEMAIETSGHCAMRENDYLDDGTYTAVKVVGLLARKFHRSGSSSSLLNLIADLEELDEVCELRMSVHDESLESMQRVFESCCLLMERLCNDEEAGELNIASAVETWSIDRENLEPGLRVRVLGEGQFFMLRKSLHDPIISLQIEALNKETARQLIIQPLLKLFGSEPNIQEALEMSALKDY